MLLNKPVPFRPLGILKTLLESLGFQITHCYEDLIFIEHNAFLLRMEERGEQVSLFFNKESQIEKRDEIAWLLETEGKGYNLTVSRLGTYTLTPNKADGTLSFTLLEGKF